MSTRFARGRSVSMLLVVFGLAFACAPAFAASLDTAAIGKAAGAAAKAQADGVVKINWSRTDVPVTVDGMQLPPPAAGLGSWAALLLKS